MSPHKFLSPPFLGKAIGSGFQFYEQPIPALSEPDFVPFFRLLLAIWQLRPADLQQLYPLHTQQGRIGFLAWCVVHGRNEYSALNDLAPFWEHLNKPAVLPETAWSGGISRHLQLIAYARADVGINPALETESQQLNLLAWFCLHGIRELEMESYLPSWQREFLRQPLKNGHALFANLIYCHRPDLQAAFDLKTTVGNKGFNHWLAQQAAQDTSIACIEEDSSPNGYRQHHPQIQVQTSSFGVNLIGHAFGELGIGEDVRMAAHALHAAGVPFTVIDFPAGADIRQGDRSIEKWVSNQPSYLINLVCLTALEHLRCYVERGEELFRNRYTIGYWPWELRDWPPNWEHCFCLADEVWASSQHIRQAAECISPVPVLTMPMAVALPELRRSGRSQFGLPQDSTLFVFSFDGNSSVARKNRRMAGSWHRPLTIAR
jgi:hypothetical protein